MRKSTELKYRTAFLKHQLAKMIERHEKIKRRNEFIKRNKQKILALSMDGWPRLKNMKDHNKWLEIVYDAKIKGIYGIGTSNCDVIGQLNRHAKDTSN